MDAQTGTRPRGTLAAVVLAAFFGAAVACSSEVVAPDDRERFVLSPQHLAQIERRRRVVVNFDAIHGDLKFADIPPSDLVKLSFTFADDPESQIDSIWWNWGEGHQSPYPSEVMPLYDQEGYRKWVEEGVDIMRIFLEATKERGLEAFYSYRVNGSDNDLVVTREIPMKQRHPEWLLAGPWTPDRKIFWDFRNQEIRDYKLSILREVVENYDFDGIEIDFARGPITLPLGQQWKYRHHLTDFMSKVRALTLEAAERRGRPILLAARLPASIEGCRIDGIDIETWTSRQLLDIIALGCRSYEGDVAAYRRITAGTPIKLLGGSDEHHTSDGYDWPPIEVLRGVFANWWQQGVDGIYCFNWTYAMKEDADRIGALLHDYRMAPVHRRLYREIGDPEMLRRKDKTFVVQRRGGGGSGAPGTVGWETPRFFLNTNMLAQLPAALDNQGKADTLLKLSVADPLGRESRNIRDISLRLILHDAAAGSHIEKMRTSVKPDPPGPNRMPRALIALFKRINHLYNASPPEDIGKRIEVRINNLLLEEPVEEDGWLVFPGLDPNLFAAGTNLVGVRVTGRSPQAGAPLFVEKLELQVDYR
ncbi:MAG: family 10 glycosylhydrolase [Acidobacteria bacterium]|nr:family 10 glycosylhydrolase [Acidobacteriota bacterium]